MKSEDSPSPEAAWAMLQGDEIHGMIFFHGGDDSAFVATRAKEKKATKRK